MRTCRKNGCTSIRSTWRRTCCPRSCKAARASTACRNAAAGFRLLLALHDRQLRGLPRVGAAVEHEHLRETGLDQAVGGLAHAAAVLVDEHDGQFLRLRQILL